VGNLSWQTIGQDKIIELFKKALERGALAHAYLLVGPPGIGKMRLALDLAKKLNCEQGKDQSPCGECPTCQKIEAGKHADVQIVALNQDVDDDESKEHTEIGIERIKDMLHSANLPPFEGRHRVYIIDEAGNLSLDAANRLLKTLEEPPPKVTFILLTENAALIPATIISRCQRLNLGRMQTVELAAALSARWQVETEKANLLARLSYGCPGWALTALQNPALREERQEKFAKMRAVLTSNYSARFGASNQLASQFSKKRESVYETLAAWSGWWRDVLLVKTSCNRDIINIDNLPGLGEMAGAYSLKQIRTAIQSINEAEAQLRQNANARLTLEALMLNLPMWTSKSPAPAPRLSG
jgi:DNA polymerase III subunit delta'